MTTSLAVVYEGWNGYQVSLVHTFELSALGEHINLPPLANKE